MTEVKKFGLTERQLQVFKMRADGMAKKEIGAKLNLSTKTIEYHEARICQIMKLKTYADLIKKAIALGVTTLCFAITVAGQTSPVTLSWNNNNDPALGVLIFSTTNVTLPMNQWPLFVYIPNPVPVSSNWYNFKTNLVPANYFFVASFTNTFWRSNGFFSNVAVTQPQLPTNLLSGLTITSP